MKEWLTCKGHRPLLLRQPMRPLSEILNLGHGLQHTHKAWRHLQRKLRLLQAILPLIFSGLKASGRIISMLY